MKAFIVFVGLSIIQMNTLQDKPVVHLQPHDRNIQVKDGGEIVELDNAPQGVFLPALPPKLDLKAKPWSVDVRNLGPGPVTVIGNSLFSVRVDVGKTVHIVSSGSSYALKP
jgi:hypothetical protein